MRSRIVYRSSGDGTGVLVAVLIGLGLTALAAWIRHAWWTIGLLMNNDVLTAGKALLAVGGIFFPPLGVLHGAWLWFN